MRITIRVRHFLLFIFIFTSAISFAQDNDLWSEESSSSLLLFQKNTKHVAHSEEKIYRLDLSLLKQKLNVVHQKSRRKSSAIIIPFPDKNGILTEYVITELSTLSPALQSKYPTIKSYLGISTDSLKTKIRFSISDFGLNVMKFSNNGAIEFIDPYTKDALTYTVYSKTNFAKDIPHSICKVIEREQNTTSRKSALSSKTNANDGNLRTFRLALSCTGEYAEFHIADQGLESETDAVKKAAVLASMNTTMTRINGVFERDVALTMQLVSNNDELIFLDPNTDGYTSNDDFKMLDEVQDKCDNIIGTTNYDIGHLFTTGLSGLAELASPCTNIKAKAVSGRTPAKGDSFDIDFVAHEMGHQFGATHSFNNSCGGNISNSTSIEPGSGTTIMGYAGICAPDIQEHSDAYFHGVSIEQMYDNIFSGNSTCAELTAIGNTAPTADAGSNYTIPISTPFSLKGMATDDGNSISYCWEQTDTQQSTMPPLADNPGGPLFRSLLPSSDNIRYFPNIQTVLNGETGSEWEQLPSVSRDLNFKLTVRDNALPIGQFATDNTKISVSDQAGPFQVTSQSTPASFYVGESKTITWDVANTDLAPVNTSLVNILFSTDGGLTYPITLAENVGNNGSYDIIVPNAPTTTGRIKVEAANNVYYAINAAHIEVIISNFVMTLNETSIATCAPENAIYTFEYNTFLGFNEETTFSLSGIPEGATYTISPASAVSDGTMVTVTISNITGDMQGNFTPALTGTAVSDEISVSLHLAVYKNIESVPFLTCPKNNSVGNPLSIEFQWTADDNIAIYEIEISTDINFNNIVDSQILENNKFISNNLATEMIYYWRIIGNNNCGFSDYSAISKFETGSTELLEFTSNETISIPDNNPNGIISTLNIADNLEISDLDVTITIEHSYVGDLKVSLRSPNQEEIVLVANSDEDGMNYTNTVFDDSASEFITNGSAPFNGSYKPIDPLAVYNSLRSTGNWELHISDNEADDEGELLSWSLSFSGIKITDESCDILSTNIHKAFSPNGDQINDFWVIENINTSDFEDSVFPKANVKIFNIRGQLVYQSNGYKNDWDGISSNGVKLPVGTYIYEVHFSKPEFESQKGWLYLKY